MLPSMKYQLQNSVWPMPFEPEPPNKNVFSSCCSSNGSLSSPEIFDLSSGTAECCLSNGCLKSGFQGGLQGGMQGSMQGVESGMWVRMGCTNPSCSELKQLHFDCFSEWQSRFLTAVNNSRSRHFSDIPIPPNFMLKNYDVLFKLCGCRCNNGILIHDFEQSSSSCSSSNEEFNLLPTPLSIPPSNLHHYKKPIRRTSFSIKDRSASFTGSINRVLGSVNGMFNGAVNKNHLFGYPNELSNSFNNKNSRFSPNNNNNFNSLQHILSNIANSNNNTNNFYPPSLLQPLNNKNNMNFSNNITNGINNINLIHKPFTKQISTPTFPSNNNNPPNTKKPHRNSYTIKTFDFFPTAEKAAAGNIFHHRITMQSFNKLPNPSRNSYHVRVEDEGPYGNDEIRCFILNTLSCLRKTTLDCVLCRSPLRIYDKYPLVDGTFFLSLEQYGKCGVEVTLTKKMQQHHQHHQQRYLNVVCLGCMNSNTSTCKGCGTPWSGEALVVGTMYNFDIFASTLCCSSRYNCQICNHPVKQFNPERPPTFSESSRPSACGKCGKEACHSIKPLGKIFDVAAGKKEEVVGV